MCDNAAFLSITVDCKRTWPNLIMGITTKDDTVQQETVWTFLLLCPWITSCVMLKCYLWHCFCKMLAWLLIYSVLISPFCPTSTQTVSLILLGAVQSKRQIKELLLHRQLIHLTFITLPPTQSGIFYWFYFVIGTYCGLKQLVKLNFGTSQHFSVRLLQNKTKSATEKIKTRTMKIHNKWIMKTNFFI